MLGRSVYHSPYLLSDIEKEIFDNDDVPSRQDIIERLVPYVKEETKKGTRLNHIMRHTVGLYHGQIGSKKWKKYLSDNMMARDSDFQKVKYIIKIVQNNEKIMQTIA